ncbi:MAG TPA: site-specific DNA-methyltransferase [Acholeplasmataceae bacterium]|nr:site-specific DNA-methyltransferase [Acholeplasmataceae bacterium]
MSVFKSENKFKNKMFVSENKEITIINSDCVEVLKNIKEEKVSLIITSPPYCMGKEYENPEDDINSFVSLNTQVIKESVRILKNGGSLCWQVGFHVKQGIIVPLDYHIYNIVESINKELPSKDKLYLHNRIIWTFGHGLNAEKRLSGRYETILWFTKGKEYTFNLDPIRIPQKYPGKKYSKGSKKGQYSGNPLGKNPSDVWDIPNVKANHIEKTEHPCQFPIVIPQRLIKALTNEGDIVVDPFFGSGTTGVACLIENRKFLGMEIDEKYFLMAKNRILDAIDGDIKYRCEFPPIEPDKNQKAAQKPEDFKW